MRTVRFLVSLAASLSVLLCPPLLLAPGLMAQQRDDTGFSGKLHEVREGDNLGSIAIRYYRNPRATDSIYLLNYWRLTRAVKQYKPNAKIDPRGVLPRGIQLRLPQKLVSARGKVYTLSGAEARPAEIRYLDDLEREASSLLGPSSTGPRAQQRPQVPREQVSTSARPANRESIPGWYENPNGELQTCAKALCDRYQSLCFFECVGLAKSFLDGGASCRKLPEKLPFYVDPATRANCAAVFD